MRFSETTAGDILIEKLGNIVFTAGDNAYAYTQIGHGGFASNGSHSGSVTLRDIGDVTVLAGAGDNSYAQIGHGGHSDGGKGSRNYDGTITITSEGSLTLTGQDALDRYAIIGHGDNPLDRDAGSAVKGNVIVSVGEDATLSNAFIGHLIDSDGTYSSGKTFVGVGQNNFVPGAPGILAADAASEFRSAPKANGGELRFYIPDRSGYQIAAGTLLNGTAAKAPGTNPLPNEQVFSPFGTGPYQLSDPGNFAFYFEQLPTKIGTPSPPVEPTIEFTLLFDYNLLRPIEDLLKGEGEDIDIDKKDKPYKIRFERPDRQNGSTGRISLFPDGSPMISHYGSFDLPDASE